MFGFLRSRPSSRAGSRAGSPAPSSGIRIQINVPSYGGLFMTRVRADADATGQDAPPQLEFQDRELTGELEIDVPRGTGRRRCRAIRLTLRNLARLYMGPERGWEEDVLFERTLEVKGAIILEEGVQRFNFSIVVPFALAPYDVHPTGRIHTDLIAEIQGLSNRDMSRGLKSMSPNGSAAPSPAATPRRGRSPVRQGSSSMSSGAATPTGDTHTPEDDGITAPENQIATQMLVSWSDPIAALDDGLGANKDVKWLRGNVKSQRSITLLYNPDPNNGVSTLDARRQGDVGGLGPFDVRFVSDVWTVCALMKITINIPEPDPRTTVFYMRVVLKQTSEITSPRDDPDTAHPIVTTTPFVLWERGVRPPPSRPTRDMPAIWRGRGGEGSDTGGISVTEVARLPTDETGRPSTLEGIISPIKVTHTLVLEVWYSVYGEDVAGKPLPGGIGQGQLRLLTADRPVVIPSCAFIPEVVELPSYESHRFDTKPCSLCKTPGVEQACRTCPVTSVPHSRHDHDPVLVGNANGICPECEKRFITDDITVRPPPNRSLDPDDGPRPSGPRYMGRGLITGKWADCACGQSLRQLEDRMRSATLDDAPPPPPSRSSSTKGFDRGRTSPSRSYTT